MSNNPVRPLSIGVFAELKQLLLLYILLSSDIRTCCSLHSLLGDQKDVSHMIFGLHKDRPCGLSQTGVDEEICFPRAPIDTQM